MTIEYFPLVNNGELTNLEDLLLMGGNEDKLFATYQDRLHIFRANALSLLIKNDAIPNSKAGWATFNMPNISEGLETNYLGGDVLLIAHLSAKPKEPYSPPTLRIMVNEAFKCEDGNDFIVRDVTVYPDGDAQYAVGTYTNRSGLDKVNFALHLFSVIDGRVAKIAKKEQKTTSTTPFLPLYDESGKGTYPIGHYRHFEDIVHALAVGSEIILNIYDEPPASVAT